MRFGAAFLVCLGLACLGLAGCAAPPSQGGGGIVSMNPCADATLLELVPPSRIAAISHYSQAPDSTSIPLDVARRFRGNNGTAEEVIGLKPDLVIASSFTAPSTREAFARAGLKVLYLGIPPSIADSKAQVTELAAALGTPAKGAALNARIDAAMAAARWTGPKAPALLWIGGNLVTGGQTLLDDLMTTTGFSNQAAHYGLTHTGHLPMERVIADPPRVMLAPEGAGHDSDSRAAILRKRAIAETGLKVTQAQFARQLVNCGGPVIPAALARLAEIRRQVR
ncbi:ABC transporter substrate-binding protein [Sphingomonas sp. ABOLD]|uniref:Iron complex transport system substrate-binding protein n=1 Tax=Sphingomonas trueperi TaxID=53317 RepID=A0A7X5XW79_9SPHN|nr:ABC transporter substrate-binding protein [Sphingomonas sp. ABOLD]NJB96491.1 iron complex transport system substrate-binding protein [Sphingomonas trueperi]RSV50184.1 ABC transporter substrate-binding protein [Sphingomonas sp. ABOLD]